MSINMLGVDDGAMEEIDNVVKIPDKTKINKTSPSIARFFQTSQSVKISQTANGESSSPPEQSVVTEKCSNKIESNRSKSLVIEDCKEDKIDMSATSLTKKQKPKWSLTWKVSKKSNYIVKSDSDFEDVGETSDDQKDQIQNNKGKKKKKSVAKGRNEKEDAKTVKQQKRNKSKKCNPDKNKIVDSDSDIFDYKMYEYRKKKTGTNADQVDLNSQTEKKEDKVKESKMETNSCDKVTELCSAGPTRQTGDVKDGLIQVNVASDQKPKKKDNAFEVLMNNSKQPVCKDKEENLGIVEAGRPLGIKQCPTECSKQDNKLCHDEPSCSLSNAFDVLMMKKKPSNIVTSQSPKKTRPKSFKLNIRYSKTMSSGRDSDNEGDGNSMIHTESECQEPISNKSKKKSIRKEQNSNMEQMDISINKITSVNLEKKSKKSSKKEKQEGKSKSELPNMVEQPSHETRMTKVKKKKRKNVESTEPRPIEIHDDVQEEADQGNKKQDISIITSPGIDDFDVPTMRTGLRKRTCNVNYGLVRESNNHKKETSSKKKDKQKTKESDATTPVSPEVEVTPGSPEVEVLMSCEVTKTVKADKPALAPQKLASIFVKQKPKEKLKSGNKSQKEILEVSASQSRQDKPSLNEAELKAVNTAFLALFSSSKTVKTQSPAVQANQQPAPWPTISHVTQCNDQTKQTNLNESHLKIRTEFDTGELQQQSQKLRLGEFTSSLSETKMLEKNKKSATNLEALSPAIVKKFISEVTSYFPGVPLRRLYKQYKEKQGLIQEDSPTTASDLVSKDTKNEKKKDEGKHKGPSERSRSKRKISTQIEDELSDKQIKKMRKRKEREKKIVDDKNETISDASVSERTRKKRDEVHLIDKEMKKSTRKRSQDNNDKEQSDKEMKSSKRKKRKTIEDELESHRVCKNVDVKSEDSRTSNVDKKDLLWTDRYQPECSSEVIGNASAVTRLKGWLEAWKIKREKTLRRELQLQKRLLAKQNNKDSQKKSTTVGWWEEDCDSDFHVSDEDSESSDNEGSGLSSAMLVVGPRGSGKTATVYACAKELGYKVFEVNCSSKRSNKQILSKLEEATQSHLVINSTNTPKPSAFGGLFANMTADDTSSFHNFIKKGNVVDQKNATSNQPRKDGMEKQKKGKVTSREEKEKQSHCSIEGDSNSRLSLKAVSLILFEEVDLVFEDDKGFWSAVTSFINNAKCPIIMTSNSSRVECEGGFEQLILKTPSVNLLSAHLQLTALVNSVLVHPDEVKTLVSLYNCDIRKCLFAMQFWILSGGGKKIKWKKFLKQKKNERKDELVHLVDEKSQNSSKPDDQVLAVLDDPSEESLFLTVDDWKTLAKRHTRASLHQDSNSDSETPKMCNLAVDENTHTDSIVNVLECDDSRSVPIANNMHVVMPDVHCLLVEHVAGLLNNTLDCKYGSMDLLKHKQITGDDVKVNLPATKCNLTQYSQSIGVNLVSSNLPMLLPSLHPQRSTNQYSSSVVKATNQKDKKGGIQDSVFLDTSVFDNGSESNPGNGSHRNHDEVSMATISSDIQEHSRNIQSVVSQDKSLNKKLNKKALDIFATIAEDLSFMDVHTQDMHCNIYHPAEFGWWNASATPGLSGDIVTVRRTAHDWWTRDTSTCIRGALEVASLECSYSRCKSLSDDNGDGDALLIENCLPTKPQSLIVNLAGLSATQLSKISSMNKLYKTVNSSLPLLAFCSHGAVCTDYLPTLRSICHSERLREITNTKRRFLHYLDSVLTMSSSSMIGLAKAFLVP